MPLRGETIGVAYVRIHADGSRLPEEVRRDLRESEPLMEHEGERHGDAYSQGFFREVDRQEPDSTLIERLHKGLGRFDAEGRLTGEHFNDSLRRELEKAFPNDVGATIFKNLEKDFAEGKVDVEGLGRRLSNLRPEVSRAVRDIEGEVSKLESDWRRDFDSINRETDKIVTSSRNELTRLQLSLRELGRDVGKSRTEFDGLFSKLSVAPLVFRNMWNEGRKSRAELTRIRAGIHDTGEVVSGFRGKVDKFDNDLDKVARSIGVAFGRGNRNNFINFFGRLVEKMLLTGNIIPKFLKGMFRISDVAGELKTVFQGSGGGGQGLLAVFQELGPALGGAVAGGVAISAVLAALAALVGPLVAIVSGLTAAVLALAGSLIFAAGAAGGALIGALLPLLPIIAGIAAALGTLTNKERTALLLKFAQNFKAIGTAFKSGFSKESANVFKNIAVDVHKSLPLMRKMGEAVGDLAKRFTGVFRSKDFDRFLKVMEVFLPKATVLWGKVLTNTFEGLLGFFRALAPITLSFLHWLDEVTAKFDRWANSKQGQNSLLDFFHKAAASAQSVGKFVGALVGLIAALSSEGRKAGNNIFDSMTASVNHLTRYLDSHPQAVRKFFKNGVNVARDLGNAIVDIVKAFGKLDTADNRKLAHDLFGAIGVAAKLMAVSFEIGNTNIRLLVGGLKALKRFAEGIPKVMAHVAGAFVEAIAKMEFGLANLLDSMGWVPFIGGKFKDAASKVRFAADATQNLANRLKNAGSQAKNAQGDVSDFGNTLARLKGKNINITANTAPANRAINALIDSISHRTATLQVYEHHHVTGGLPALLDPGNFGANPKKKHAAGYITSGPEMALIGESGREAVVPLDRPLSSVDPAVRQLAALARGGTNPGKVINVGGVQIVTPTTDPRAVASELLNQLAGKSLV